MIHYVATERFLSTVENFLAGFPDLRGHLRPLSYEELFFERAGPIGHYIFTDFDRLSRYELECAAAFARALAELAPVATILNHPLRAMERYPLLAALHRAGINDFAAIRVETGERPPAYPVFIRAEDGYGGPETDLIHDDAGFDAALARLADRGLPRRGRIAVGYAASRDADGYFRKYGAFNVFGRIIPQHIHRSGMWVTKRNLPEHSWAYPATREAKSADIVSEELEFVRQNPHRDVLLRAFEVGGIEFGRADYGIVDGRVQIYEINTNPHFPRLDARGRGAERTSIIKERMSEAFRAIDRPLPTGGRVRFAESRPRAHSLHLPRRRLARSVARRLRDKLARCPRPQEESAG